MGATSTTSLDFGSDPGSPFAVAVVTGQAGVVAATTAASAFFQGDVTSDHTDMNHIVAAALITLTCSDFIDGVGFTIYAIAEQNFTGVFTIHWVWV